MVYRALDFIERGPQETLFLFYEFYSLHIRDETSPMTPDGFEKFLSINPSFLSKDLYKDLLGLRLDVQYLIKALDAFHTQLLKYPFESPQDERKGHDCSTHQGYARPWSFFHPDSLCRL